MGEDADVNWRISSLVKGFVSPQTSLGDLDASSAATLISAASDVTLILDAGGIIRDVAFSSDDLWHDLGDSDGWVDRPFATTVAADSREKVEALLQDAGSSATSRWRHVNHITAEGDYLPVRYCTVQIGEERGVVAFGRDMRAFSALQQRLISAQQSMERDYARLREVEMRYRLLFTMSTEAVLILDAAASKVVDANPAARKLLRLDPAKTGGRELGELLAADSLPAVQAHLNMVRSGMPSPDARAHLARGRAEVRVGASLFRQESGSLFLVRISPSGAAPEPDLSEARTKLLKAVESAPDGFVVTGEDGRILIANEAFLGMAQLVSEAQARGKPLDQWIGESGVEYDVLIGNLRQRGSVRAFMTSLRGDASAITKVEISAVSIRNGGKPSFGFAIRNVGSRLPLEARSGPELPRSVEQLTELIGRVSLKELVRESTDLIERLCIEAALQLTGDNRASAAQILGLSRQSLYMKLRRYGLGGDVAAYGEN